MKPYEVVRCDQFTCQGIQKAGYYVSDIDVDPVKISIVMISEASPLERKDHYYTDPPGLFAQTTILAFKEAGVAVASIQELLAMGIYLTTAVKCAKTDYIISAQTIKTCSMLLEKELEPFENVKAYLLMGDVAIKSFNGITMRKSGQKVIPAGSTYKIRKNQFEYNGARVYPSYLQAGPSFFMEKGKRKVIAEDIRSALALPALGG